MKASAALFHGLSYGGGLLCISSPYDFMIHEWDLRLHHMYAWMLLSAQGVFCIGLLLLLELVPPLCIAYFVFSFCSEAFGR